MNERELNKEIDARITAKLCVAAGERTENFFSPSYRFAMQRMCESCLIKRECQTLTRDSSELFFYREKKLSRAQT